MSALSPTEVAAQLKSLPSWNVEDGELVRTFSFVDFLTAMRFVNEVAVAAQVADHHPDIDIRYNKVRLGLVTHSEGGITAMDFALAAASDKLA
jgi:4a-hydroxytetrahydrobiopterin dehydratase